MTLRGFSSDQVRAAEAPHLAAGVPLMQRAAATLAAEIRALCPADAARVLLLVGSGDNGGDALFAGALLATAGITVDVVGTGSRMHRAGLTAALGAGATVRDAAEAGGLAASADVVVDGVLGIGVTGSPALRGRAREIVVEVLRALERDEPARVVAVDVPSGIGPDDGAVPYVAILRADVTVTFGAAKAGLLLEPGASFAGEVRVVDIGLGGDYAAMTPVVEVAEAISPPERRVQPPRSRAQRRLILAADLVSAIALSVLVGGTLVLLANDLSAQTNGAIADRMFGDIGRGFTDGAIYAAWSTFGVAAAVLAFSGFAGIVLRRSHDLSIGSAVLIFGIALGAGAYAASVFLESFSFTALLIAIPVVSLALVMVWMTTLPALRHARPEKNEEVERRMQRRIDIALGVASRRSWCSSAPWSS